MGLHTLDRSRHLFFGETLCGACKNACPVDIDLPRMLLALRHRWAEGHKGDLFAGSGNAAERMIFKTWAETVRRPALYRMAMQAVAAGQLMLPKKEGRLTRLPHPVDGWTRGRDLTPLARKGFVKRWQEKLEKAKGRTGS
jgi:L-lactate dehydrogenase complex protein LldF